VIFEDTYGHSIDTDALYKCSNCGWIGKVEEMDGGWDCSDMYDAIHSDYCCPNYKCWAFYLFITDWERL
jgi:hypothetical protein